MIPPTVEAINEHVETGKYDELRCPQCDEAKMQVRFTVEGSDGDTRYSILVRCIGCQYGSRFSTGRHKPATFREDMIVRDDV